MFWVQDAVRLHRQQRVVSGLAAPATSDTLEILTTCLLELVTTSLLNIVHIVVLWPRQINRVGENSAAQAVTNL